MARPIKWTDDKKKEALNIIFEQITNGKSLRSILDNADRNTLPSNRIFLEWLDNDEKLSKQYARACAERADYIFEDIINIADNVGQDIIEVDGKELVNNAVINRDRLRVEARKWAVSKMNPKKYGDKLEIDSVIDDKRKSIDELFPTDKELLDD